MGVLIDFNNAEDLPTNTTPREGGVLDPQRPDETSDLFTLDMSSILNEEQKILAPTQIIQEQQPSKPQASSSLFAFMQLQNDIKPSHDVTAYQGGVLKSGIGDQIVLQEISDEDLHVKSP